MEVDNVRFPLEIETGMKGGPRFNVTVWTTGSGTEFRNLNSPRSPGRWSFDVGPYDTDVPQNAIDTVVEMFWAARGKLYGFLLRDWVDYRATNQPLLAVPDTPDTYQLVRVYDNGVRTATRKITRPEQGTVVVYNSGVPIAATIDYENGRITVAEGTEETLTADYQFFVPVRFDVDDLDIEVILDGLKDLKGVTVSEILE